MRLILFAVWRLNKLTSLAPVGTTVQVANSCLSCQIVRVGFLWNCPVFKLESNSTGFERDSVCRQNFPIHPDQPTIDRSATMAGAGIRTMKGPKCHLFENQNPGIELFCSPV
jgi:hypothetical protein